MPYGDPRLLGGMEKKTRITEWIDKTKCPLCDDKKHQTLEEYGRHAMLWGGGEPEFHRKQVKEANRRIWP
jgi:hypothetical protein